VIDVLDHVLDKGIVIDAWVRVSLAGIDLVSVEARIIVASISTYVAQAPSLAELATVAAPYVVSLSGGRSIADQLLRVRQSLEAGWALPAVERHRAEDRILDDFRDAHTRIVPPGNRVRGRRRARPRV